MARLTQGSDSVDNLGHRCQKTIRVGNATAANGGGFIAYLYPVSGMVDLVEC